MKNTLTYPNYHEAGHAVIAHKLGRKVLEVSTRYTRLNPTTEEKIQSEEFRNDPKAIKNEIIIVLAGHSAKNGRPGFSTLDQEKDDKNKAMRLAALIVGDDAKKQSVLVKQMYHETCDLVETNKYYWKAIEDLAEELEKKGELNGDEAIRIIEQNQY